MLALRLCLLFIVILTYAHGGSYRAGPSRFGKATASTSVPPVRPVEQPSREAAGQKNDDYRLDEICSNLTPLKLAADNQVPVAVLDRQAFVQNVDSEKKREKDSASPSP